MTIFRVVVVAAGIFGAVSVADIPSSTVQAAERAIRAGNTATPAPADQISPAPEKTVGAVVPKRRKKKRARARGKALRRASQEASEAFEASETAPGKRLSSKEVMALLRTNRDLSGKNLSGLNLMGVNLSKCNLKGVDLSNADLERADLGESDLERANLAGANLKMVNLRLSGMIGANLEKAILDGAIWQDGRICAKGSFGMCREAVSPNSAK
jgi:hypothetical protein